MANYGGMSWKKVKAVVCCAMAASILSGCSMTRIDELRPEVNREQGMMLDPDFFEAAVGLTDEDWSSTDVGGPAGSVPNLPEMDIGRPSEGEGIVDGDDVDTENLTTASLLETTVSATSYSKYLQNHVVNSIVTVADSMGSSPWDRIYFRVLHTGYDPVGVSDSLVMEPRKPAYEFKFINSTLTYVGGKEMSTFAYNYLSSLGDNAKSVRNQRNSTLEAISKFGDSSTWMNVKASSDADRLSDILEMWGNERLGADTVSEYKAAVNRSVIGTVPNLAFKVKKYGYGTESAVLNNTTGGPHYVDRVSYVALGKIFTAVNQYEDHIPARTFDGHVVADQCLIWYKIDGWSKTIVLIGCDNGVTLKEIFGDRYDSIEDIMTSIYKNTEWVQISSLEGMEDSTTIAKGARGTE